MLKNLSKFPRKPQTSSHRFVSSLSEIFNNKPQKAEIDKSILEKDAEKKEKWQPEDPEEGLNKRKLTLRELKIEQDKTRLKWRKPFDEDDKIWRSKFNAFNSNENDMSLMMLLQQPWDVSPKNLKRMYAEYKLNKEAYEQGYIEERMKMLGPDLAIAHWATYRNGKVKFKGDTRWMTKEDNEKLPRKFDPNYIVEAVNFDNNPLHYEGVENFKDLLNCKSISLRNCRHFNDWCLDRLSGNLLPCLEELDIAGSDVTIRGCGVFYRFSALKRLIIDKEVKNSIEWQLVFAMLEEMKPDLEVLDSKDHQQQQ